VFTARYALRPYMYNTRFMFEGLVIATTSSFSLKDVQVAKFM
jgi:hypothetical protein